MHDRDKYREKKVASIFLGRGFEYTKSFKIRRHCGCWYQEMCMLGIFPLNDVLIAYASKYQGYYWNNVKS